jgi:hypothetical protein
MVCWRLAVSLGSEGNYCGRWQSQPHRGYGYTIENSVCRPQSIPSWRTLYGLRYHCEIWAMRLTVPCTVCLISIDCGESVLGAGIVGLISVPARSCGYRAFAENYTMFLVCRRLPGLPASVGAHEAQRMRAEAGSHSPLSALFLPGAVWRHTWR